MQDIFQKVVAFWIFQDGCQSRTQLLGQRVTSLQSGRIRGRKSVGDFEFFGGSIQLGALDRLEDTFQRENLLISSLSGRLDSASDPMTRTEVRNPSQRLLEVPFPLRWSLTLLRILLFTTLSRPAGLIPPPNFVNQTLLESSGSPNALRSFLPDLVGCSKDALAGGDLRRGNFRFASKI